MIICKNLELGYNCKNVTQAFDLEINDNQWIGVIGKNGAGKSTFLKTMLGVIPIVRGDLTILGQRPGECNNLISYIPQEREINLADRMSGTSLI
ncbi:MAG: ATP-binding cassette domain-containing protein, partial [Neisseriaceae bacterium]